MSLAEVLSPQTETTAMVDGKQAVARIAYAMNEVIAIYPITPSSSMGEWADAWSSAKQKNLWGTIPAVVEMQSEGGLSHSQTALPDSRSVFFDSVPCMANRTGESGLRCGAHPESTSELVESTSGLVESTSGLVESTSEVVESTSGLVESTSGLVESTSGLVESTSSSSVLNLWVEFVELDTRLVDGETPPNMHLIFVARRFPGRDFTR